VGTVISTGSPELDSQWKGKRVILNPGYGWKDSPIGPEKGNYAILGGTKFNPLGTLQEFAAVEASEVEEAPSHLSDVEAAALPLTGLTAFRALFTKSRNAEAGHNILVTGIGGGVALMALQFASAAGCNVFVTSGSQEKLDKAKKLGAVGGVIYKEEGWDKKLLELLPQDRKYLDAVIDGAGGDVVAKTTKALKVSL
jgi:NADPH:quinone reductase-like Zn-dependent oxidoreductase